MMGTIVNKKDIFLLKDHKKREAIQRDKTLQSGGSYHHKIKDSEDSGLFCKFMMLHLIL